MPAVGRAVSEVLLRHFSPRFDVLERTRLRNVLDELQLRGDELGHGASGREIAQLAKVRYLVVGSVTPLAGVTVQACLIEASTGLIVQTVRVSAPNIEALMPMLKHLARVLQMSDEEKVAFETKLQADAVAIQPIDASSLDVIPPLSPAVDFIRMDRIVTYTSRSPLLGELVIRDFDTLPPVVVGAPAGVQAYEGNTVRADSRRNRLLRLSLDLGDNLFRRKRFQEAQRHYSLALSLAGPRREISSRLDACRNALPPPLPPVVGSLPPRPRLAVFGFVFGATSDVLPENLGAWTADCFASHCGDYEAIDRGELAWYMGRLGFTVREVLSDPVSRRYLAQALERGYFVFVGIQQTGSFDVHAHLIDVESGTRTGTAMIHVQDRFELKLRMNELVRQIGVKPAEREVLIKQGRAIERSLIEARVCLQKEPGRAAELLRALKLSVGNIALQSLLADAEARQRLVCVRRRSSGRGCRASRLPSGGAETP